MANDRPHEQQHEQHPERALPPARRTVLAGTGIVGAAALLTACGSSSSNASGGSSTASGTGSGATPGTASGNGSSAPAAGAGGGGASSGSSGAAQGLTATSAIPVGGGKVFQTQRVVVTQPTSGEFKCFTAVCTHQGCIVGSVADGLITCPCHGSQYRITDGSVVHGPAPTPLASKSITVSDGEISLA
jgi:Rieske Fe-S protein